MRKAKRDTTYEDGVEQFLAFAYRDIPQDSEILCPCKRCKNRLNLSLDEVRTHLRCDGILQGYTTWVHHGENYERPTDPFVDVPNITGILGTSGPVQDDQHGESDSMQELLRAALGMAATISEGGVDDFQSGYADTEHNVFEDYVNAAEGDASGKDIAEDGVNYYGRLLDILELSYADYKVVLFKCEWYDVHHQAGLRQDEFGFTLVNFSRKIHTGEKLEHDPFVFSSQVQQVFYVQDPKAEAWHTVVKFSPRDTFDMGAEPSPDEAD